MIPKVIHYCWFSGDKKPRFIKNCIKSWKRVMPDYEIKCWDANSFDFDSVPFVKQAIEKKKWAFAADYVRLYALYTEGGIYLDSDVVVYKRFDDFLDNSFFSGTESTDKEIGSFTIEAAIMGAEKGNEYVRKCMEYYQHKNFILPDGSLDHTIMPQVIVQFLLPFGYEREDKLQKLQDNMTIYPFETFRQHAWHRCYGSWAWYRETRGKFYNFMKDMDLLHIHKWLETIARKFTGK